MTEGANGRRGADADSTVAFFVASTEMSVLSVSDSNSAAVYSDLI